MTQREIFDIVEALGGRATRRNIFEYDLAERGLLAMSESGVGHMVQKMKRMGYLTEEPATRTLAIADRFPEPHVPGSDDGLEYWRRRVLIVTKCRRK